MKSHLESRDLKQGDRFAGRQLKFYVSSIQMALLRPSKQNKRHKYRSENTRGYVSNQRAEEFRHSENIKKRNLQLHLFKLEFIRLFITSEE